MPRGKKAVEGAVIVSASKQESPTLDVEKLLTKLFEQTLPQMMTAVVTAIKKAESEAYQARQPKPPGEKCQDCGQYKIACKDKHRQAVIYPKNYRAKYAKFFSGVYINGVKYLSPRPGAAICIPADSFPEIDVEGWERNEVEMLEGREATFNTGVISARGNSTTFQADARAGWRQ